MLEHKIDLLCTILGIVLYVIRELMYQQTVTNLLNDVVWLSNYLGGAQMRQLRLVNSIGILVHKHLVIIYLVRA